MINKRVIIAFFIAAVSVVGLKVLFEPIALTLSSLFSSNCSQATHFFNTDKKLIALTINNVPDNNHIFPHTTLGILDVLANHEAKATFFINIDKAKFPALITSIVQQGHELGHYLTDDRPSIKLGNKFETEFIEADRFLSQFATITWFRPDRDRCNFNINRVVKKYNYKIVLGSHWSNDTNLVSPQFSNWYIKQNIRPGAIVILHDSDDDNKKGQTAIAVLNKIIPQLQQQGYRFVTLSELDRESSQ